MVVISILCIVYVYMFVPNFPSHVFDVTCASITVYAVFVFNMYLLPRQTTVRELGHFSAADRCTNLPVAGVASIVHPLPK